MTKKCPKCGYPMSWNAKRCAGCGWKDKLHRLGVDKWTRYGLAVKQEVAWFKRRCEDGKGLL